MLVSNPGSVGTPALGQEQGLIGIGLPNRLPKLPLAGLSTLPIIKLSFHRTRKL